MSKTKVIYFLSAIVLIIGCYALNLSYSLFIQTEESDIVNTTVPVLSYELVRNQFSIPANDRKIIKLQLKNTGTADLNYGFFVENEYGEEINSDLIVSWERILDGEELIGQVRAGESVNVYLYVRNTGDEEHNIVFNPRVTYSTVKLNEDEIYNDSIDVATMYLENHSTLSSRLLNDTNNLPLNASLSKVTSVAEINMGLFPAQDDFGTSYYYRGKQDYNYVNFAGFTWRVVRINGDGTIRLILNDTTQNVCGSSNSTVCKNSKFNEASNDNGYVGYMYGMTGVTGPIGANAEGCYVYVGQGSGGEIMLDAGAVPLTKEDCDSIKGAVWFTRNSSEYELTHSHIVNSYIKKNLDLFYITYLLNKYDYGIADTIFCGDKTKSSTSVGTDNTALGYGLNKTVYQAHERIFANDLTYYYATPKLTCNDGLSIYTVNNFIINGVNHKGSLNHPIGLISADEAVLAGAYNATTNSNYYLAGNAFWTMSPTTLFNDIAHVGLVNSSTGSIFYANVAQTEFGVRPVINLKANVFTYPTHNGTSSTPYGIILVDE